VRAALSNLLVPLKGTLFRAKLCPDTQVMALRLAWVNKLKVTTNFLLIPKRAEKEFWLRLTANQTLRNLEIDGAFKLEPTRVI